MRCDVFFVDAAEFGLFVLDGLVQEVLVIGVPRSGGDEVVVVLGLAHDSVFGTGRASACKGVGQVDAPHARQLVRREPVEEGGGARPGQAMLCKGRGIDQASAGTDRFGLCLGILPPAAAPERPGVVIEAVGRIERAVVIRALPSVHLPELRAQRLLAVVCGRCPQRTTRLAFLVGVMKHVDVGIAFLVLLHRVFGGHPRAVALGIKAGHVDLGLAFDHQLGKVVASAARRRDPERKAFRQPHVSQARSRTEERVAVGRVADRAVIIVLQPDLFRGRDSVDEGHVFFFDPLQIEREEVGAEAVGATVFEPRGGVFLVRAKDPAAAFLAHVPLRIRVAQDRMLGVVFAPCDQCWVGFGDDVLMLNRNGRDLDAEKLCSALGMVARGGHDMFGTDRDLFVGRNKVAALFDHLGRHHIPVIAGPGVAVDLPAPLDFNAARTSAFGHGLRHISGVNVAVRWVIDCANQILGAHQWPAVLDVGGRHPFIGNPAGFGGRGIKLILVHPRLALRHAQVADDEKSRVQARLFFQCLVELDRVVMDMRGRIAHVEIGEQTSSVPCRPRRQLVPLQKHDIRPASLGQMIGNRRAHGPAADNQCFDMGFHSNILPDPTVRGLSQTRQTWSRTPDAS